MSKIFVGNFSFGVDENSLREFFSKVGQVVSVRIMKDKMTGRSRGFGFVEFSDAATAQRAIQECDGKMWEGRTLKISEERKREQ